MKKIISLLTIALSTWTAFGGQKGLDPALIGRGFDASGAFQIMVESGPLEIESSTDLANWHPLMKGNDLVVDKTSTNAEWRYYRAAGVSNVLGFVRIPIEPGKMVPIASPFHVELHLDKAPVRKLVFGTEAPPVFISIMKNGKQTGYGYDDLEKNFMPALPPIPWGEAFIVRNDGKQRIYVHLWGQVPEGNLKRTIPKGENMIAALVPKAGPVHDAAGAKGIEGAQLLVFDEQKQAYQTSTFNKATGRWDPPLHYKPGRAIVAKYPEASTQAAMVVPSKTEK